jgi:hypothetical protein
VTGTLDRAMRIVATPQHGAQRAFDRAMTAACAVACLLALHCLLLAGGAAQAQTPSPEPPATSNSPATPISPAPPPPAPQGFIDAFGNWVQQGVANVGAGFGAMVGAVGGQANQAAKGAADAASTVAKGAADVARDTASSVPKLPTGVIAGRERCILAPNGAPDCRAAAETMCRAKGYVGGASVDFETAEKCPPPYRVSSRNTPEGVCSMEHFVTKALCQ